ncbi:hypothetical protein DL96DRAFT_558249 [Flagelloscypha sp. PMI_526]|nr:hypothetical protein DL96DRAFT_558249 [Flagelloscypha sp. PMI_526]
MGEPRSNGLKVLTFDGEADIRVGVLPALYSLRDMMRRAVDGHPELAAAGETNADSSSSSDAEALPCNCFDLIVGSGDGGWVAIMLGRLRMSTSQVIQMYLQVRSRIHDTYPYNGPVNTWNAESMAADFEDRLKLIVTASVKDVEETFEIQNPTCHVVALAKYAESDAPHPALFRNYKRRGSYSPKYTIWFAMRAVASSTIFPPALMSSTYPKFVAASKLNFNNPVEQAISEAEALAEHLGITGPPLACLVSLGAGHPGVRAINVLDLEKTAIRLTQDAEAAHERTLKLLRVARNLCQSHETYFRVNVEQGLQTASLQQITPGAILTHTTTYLDQVKIRDLTNSIVKHVLGDCERQSDSSG